jgi:hypothetical protein
MNQQPSYEPDFENMNEIDEIAGLAVSDLSKDIEAAINEQPPYTDIQEEIRSLLTIVTANPELWKELSIIGHSPRSLVLSFHEALNLATQRRDPYDYFKALVAISLSTYSISMDFAINQGDNIEYRLEMASVVGILFASIFNGLKSKFKRLNSSNEIHSLILQTIDNFGTENKPKRGDFVNTDLPELEQNMVWNPIENRYNERQRKLQPFKNAIKETMNQMIAFYG